MSTTRNSVIIYRDFMEAMHDVPEKSYKKIMNAVMSYAMDGKEPTNLTGLEKVVFSQAKIWIDNNNRKYENGQKGGRPRNQNETEQEPNENQNETKTKPKHNQRTTKEQPNDNQTITKAEPNLNLNDKCKVLSDKYIVSKKERNNINIFKKQDAYARESYDDLMDAWELSFAVREAVERFIRHCTLNGQILTNDRLDGIIAELELHRENDDEKIQAINDAINGGYFDIRRGFENG